MNKFILISFLIFIPSVTQALIFDNGSRRAKVSEAPDKVRWAALGVASVFSPSGFIEQENGSYLIKKYQMNSVPNTSVSNSLRMLCETELYSREYRAASLKGSGLLITPEHIVAPAHLFDKSTDCKERKIVFGYTGDEDIVPGAFVYRCIERQFIRYDVKPKFRPKNHEYGTSKFDGHMDYAIIKLDRPVKAVDPVKTSKESEKIQVGDQLYFVSSMRGLNQTFEKSDVKYVSPAVVSTNATTAQGSSGGSYFTEDGFFVGMHISSNPASNSVDNDSNCLNWVEDSSETFDWETLVYVKDRDAKRPFGALMLPLSAFKKKLFAVQANYYEKLAKEKEQHIQALPVMTKEALKKEAAKQKDIKDIKDIKDKQAQEKTKKNQVTQIQTSPNNKSSKKTEASSTQEQNPKSKTKSKKVSKTADKSLPQDVDEKIIDATIHPPIQVTETKKTNASAKKEKPSPPLKAAKDGTNKDNNTKATKRPSKN